MHLPVSVTQDELLEVLLQVAPVRPVFIWGAPGIGKSALVEKFADEVGLPCVSLLGSQLAPEDIHMSCSWTNSTPVRRKCRKPSIL